MDRIQLRRDTAARWAEINPVLLEGEVGYETDTKLRKIGDGVKRWNELGYLKAEGIVQETGTGENVVMSQKAVSGKLGELKAEIDKELYVYSDIAVRTNNYYNGVDVKVGDTYSKPMTYVTGLACVKLSVTAGEEYVLYGDGSDYVRRYIITDSNNVVTRISTDNSRSEIRLVIKIGETNLYASWNEYDASVDYIKSATAIAKKVTDLENQTTETSSELQGQSARLNLVESSVLKLEKNIYPITEVKLNNYYNGGGLSIGSIFAKSYQYYSGSACAKLSVKAGEKYIYKGEAGEYVRAFIITDSDNEVTQISPSSVSRTPIEITINEGDANLYVSFDGYDESTDYLMKIISLSDMLKPAPFKDKTIVCFGDSITEFTLDGKGVPYHLAEMSAANVINVAVGGTRLAQRANPIISQPNSEYYSYAAHDLTALVSAIDSEDYSQLEYAAQWLKDNLGDDNTEMVARLKTIDWNNVDAVTILIGTNDYAAGTPIGQADGENVETIKGAINYITSKLLTKYPHLTIYWFTPIPRWMTSSLDGRTDENWAGNKQNSIGKTLVDYCDEIISQTKEVGIPVCDLYHTIGWTKYNLGNYLTPNGTDGVHPYLGFDKIARKMLSFIKANRVFL